MSSYSSKRRSRYKLSIFILVLDNSKNFKNKYIFNSYMHQEDTELKDILTSKLILVLP